MLYGSIPIPWGGFGLCCGADSEEEEWEAGSSEFRITLQLLTAGLAEGGLN